VISLLREDRIRDRARIEREKERERGREKERERRRGREKEREEKRDDNTGGKIRGTGEDMQGEALCIVFVTCTADEKRPEDKMGNEKERIRIVSIERDKDDRIVKDARERRERNG